MLKRLLNSKLETATAEQLVERFAVICLDQPQALLYSDIAKFNRLYGRMVRSELLRRVYDPFAVVQQRRDAG